MDDDNRTICENAWKKCIECELCKGDFTTANNTTSSSDDDDEERRPLVSKCGHTLCTSCLGGYQRAAKNDFDGVLLPQHLWGKKCSCLLNCFIRSTKRIHDGATRTVETIIADAYVFDKPIVNRAFECALDVLIPLRAFISQQSNHTADELVQRIEDIQKSNNPFFQCQLCHTPFVSQEMKANNRHHLHEQAPMVGTCGHTMCAACAMMAHAQATQGVSNKLKFSCPIRDCRNAKEAWRGDRLNNNLQFRFAMAYWEDMLEWKHQYQQQQQQQQQAMDPVGEDEHVKTEVSLDTVDTAEESLKPAALPRGRVKLEEDPATMDSSGYWKLVRSFIGVDGKPTMVAVKVEDDDDAANSVGQVDDDDDGADDDEDEAESEGDEVPQRTYWHLIRRIKQEDGTFITPGAVTTSTDHADANDNDSSSDDNDDVSVVNLLDSDDDDSGMDEAADGSDERENNGSALGTAAAAKPALSVAKAPVDDGGGEITLDGDKKRPENEGYTSKDLNNQLDNNSLKKKPAMGVNVGAAPGAPFKSNEDDGVIDLLSDSDDDDSEHSGSDKESPIKKLRMEPQRSRQIYTGAAAIELLEDVWQEDDEMGKLHFLCFDEFSQPWKWHTTHDDNDWIAIVPDKYVKHKLGTVRRYNYMLRESLSMNFLTLKYTGKATNGSCTEWVVSTNNLKDRHLESDFVVNAFRPEFLSTVMSESSKRHTIESWCRTFPQEIQYPQNNRPRSEISSWFSIQFPFTNHRKDWKLLLAFASALSMNGHQDAAVALYESGAGQPSDNLQTERLGSLIEDHLPNYRLKHSKLNRPIKSNFAAELPAEDAPLIVRPLLARGSHVTCFLVIFRGKIFEPSFGHALWLKKETLDLCCGGSLESGEFVGAIETWNLVKRT